MKPKNEIEVVEYTRDKEVADPNSLVLDGDGEVGMSLPCTQESPRQVGKRFSCMKNRTPGSSFIISPRLRFTPMPKMAAS